jgi:group I intron endonuclease
MATYCVYKLTNMITLMAYVGITETDRFDDRMGEHEDPKSGPTMLITKAINKDGWENFKVEILIDNVPLKGLDENFYIERENTRTPHGYNQIRGTGSGTVSYNEQQKKWKVLGPQPDQKFVGYYDNEEKANEAADLFVRTGERMESDRIIRKKGTGTIGITDRGRFEARIVLKGKEYTGTFDTWDEGDAFCRRMKETHG